MKRTTIGLVSLSAALSLGALLLVTNPAESEPPADWPTPSYSDAFWQLWSDGQAECCGYDLVYPRYGQKRKGTAVTIFVKEDFSNSARVKADPGRHPDSDTFPVMKLNLIQDFHTGVYDYNMMTSSFVALESKAGHNAGQPSKVSLTSQEWCGHVYHHVLFDKDAVRSVSHSYFDGEADSQSKLKRGPKTLSEDALFHWARGMAAPSLKPGESCTATVLRSLEHVRLAHKELAFETATLSRSKAQQSIKVPAGSFKVETLTCAFKSGLTWTFYVEASGARRLIRWTSSAGHDAQMVGATRMKYWSLNAEGGQKWLEKIGLKARAARKT